MLYDYYSRVEKIRCLPDGEENCSEPGPETAATYCIMGGDKFTSWGKLDSSIGRPAGTWGSYGLNEWVNVPGPGHALGHAGCVVLEDAECEGSGQ